MFTFRLLFPSACLIGTFSIMTSVAVRAMLTKVGLEDDAGKIFALVSSLEASIPIVAIPALTLVYNHTLSVFPGTVFLVQAGIFAVIFLIMLYVYYLTSRPEVRYGHVPEVDEDVVRSGGFEDDHGPTSLSPEITPEAIA